MEYRHDYHYVDEYLGAIYELINGENCSSVPLIIEIQTEEIMRNSFEIELCIDLLQDLKENEGKTREELWEEIKAWAKQKVSTWFDGFRTYYQWGHWEEGRIVL